MFEVFRRKDKGVKILLTVLLGMVALSMLIYLIPGAGMGGSGAGPEVIAEVGNEKVTSKELQQLIQQRLASRQVPPEMMQYLLPQLIDQQIADRAIAYQAKRMGFEVTDAELANTIRSLPNLGALPPDQYKAYIESLGLTVAEFEDNFRKQQAVIRFQDIALQGVIVTPAEIEQEFKRRNEKIKVEYVAFDPAKVKQEIKPTEDELKVSYAATKGYYTTPESRDVLLVVADPQAISQQIEVSEQQIQSYYSSHKDDFRTPERVHVRHLLLMTQGKPKEEVTKIRAHIDDLLKQVKAGADLGKLAAQYSEDPGSKVKSGDLGWVTRGQMVKNFETASFSLKPNEISDVVTTEYGFHIVQALEKQQAGLRPFDEVKFLISGELKRSVLNDKVQNAAEQARAQIVKSPKDAEKIATSLGLPFSRAEKFKSGDALPFVSTDKDVSSMVSGLKKGEVGPVTAAGGRLVVAIATEVYPPHPAAFEEVQAQVKDRLQTDQAVKIVADRAKRAADMLNGNGGDLKAVAKAFSGEIKTTDFFGRQGAAEGLGSASYFESAFPKEPGYIIGSVNVGPQTVVAKLADKQAADPARLANERDGILFQLKGKKAEERSQLFQDSVLTKLTQEGKVKVHKDVINKILARYRSA